MERDALRRQIQEIEQNCMVLKNQLTALSKVSYLFSILFTRIMNKLRNVNEIFIFQLPVFFRKSNFKRKVINDATKIVKIGTTLCYEFEGKEYLSFIYYFEYRIA